MEEFADEWFYAALGLETEEECELCGSPLMANNLGDKWCSGPKCSWANNEMLIEFKQGLIDALKETNLMKPEIVCLCGSTKFWREYQKWNLHFTLENKIVLSIGAATGTDDKHFGNLPKAEYDRIKTMLDELHKRKIDLADYVFIINVGGYIGESTRSEIEYAEKLGKRIEYLEAI